ncbi:anti-sigma factor RsbA family regulatory protein [Actinosynnema sp. NPDC047251]|uniref:Transcriptional regulator n=1 Tax=Saccharothrix espanaensis (strain ATCC 51144 / DSM 44229 / JCM 9112 / NBRC 15066 / NRRL 15764) TaxID=1179773 RepID=K0K2P0_SACES|nr:anti-sigma factor RsbA family regulatory protein [Saccharothrix espanaensis]CCH32571.1 Transcriptional regulator [Saccharothrix espanaensis DSM 44229]
MTTTTPPPAGFVHPALFYSSDEEYLGALVPFITDGLAEGHPAAVAVPGARLLLLREALGAAADDVLMLDMEVAGRNPGRIIPTVLRRFADAHRSGHVRIIGEPIWAGRTDLEYPACAQHEALINLAFVGRDVTIVCPYDTRTLGDRALTDALATHPTVWETTGRRDSEHYDPHAVVDRYNRPLRAAPDATGLDIRTTADIRDVRRLAGDRARQAHLDAERTADLELIATELATNSLRHTDAGCRLRIWRDEEHLICSVEDDGRLTDLLAGRRPPEPGQHGGRGLLLVNQLADLVRTHATARGTTVTAFLRTDG